MGLHRLHRMSQRWIERERERDVPTPQAFLAQFVDAAKRDISNCNYRMKDSPGRGDESSLSLLERGESEGSGVTPWLLRREGRQQEQAEDIRKDGKTIQAAEEPSCEQERPPSGLNAASRAAELHTSEELRWCILGAVIFVLAVVCLGFVTRAVPVHRLSKVADLHHAVTHGGPVDVAAARPPLFDQPDCFTENRYLWEPAKKLWCCREVGIGCSMTSMPSSNGAARLKVWLAPKQVAGEIPGSAEWLKAHNELQFWPDGLIKGGPAILCNVELFPRVSKFLVPVSMRCLKPCFTRQQGSCRKIMSLIRVSSRVGQILQTVFIDSKQLD
eukprot:s2532_g7.t1